MIRDPHPTGNRRQGQGRIPHGHKKNKKKNRRGRPTDRLQEPFFPGGMTSVGDFRKERAAAVNQEFGPEEQDLNTTQNQIPAWYDDYLKKLQGLQTQTTTQYQGLQNQASSLAEAVHSQTPEGQKAADARNNIVKAIQGALIQQQGAAQTRNTEMQGVATLSRNQKYEQVGKARTDLARRKGDFASTYTEKRRQSEFENSLAAKQFGLDVEDAKTKRIEAKNTPKSETTYEKEFSKQASKHGFSPHDWALLGPKGRAKRIQEAQTRSGTKPKSLGRIEKEEAIKQAAKYGYSLDDWQALKPQQRSALIRGGKTPKDKGTEFDWRTPNQRGQGASRASQTKQILGSKDFKGISRHDAAKKILSDAKAPEPVLVSAALDAQYDKHLSRETARRLQKAGFKATEIAKALGIPTYTEWRRSHSKKGSKAKGLVNPFD